MSKGAHQSSEEKEQQYQSIFEAAVDGLVIGDLETDFILEANVISFGNHSPKRISR